MTATPLPLFFGDWTEEDQLAEEFRELPDLTGHDVVAVLVTHDGARWLPTALRGLDEQIRPVDHAVIVDTGSRDATTTLLADLADRDSTTNSTTVLSAPRNTGFGQAVAQAAQVAQERTSEASQTRWLWLLHDDAYPVPDALAQLLATATRYSSIGVLGPKIRGWRRGRDLREVGVTITGSGRRVTGLEQSEQDQGQHDGLHDVLSVSSAGMLVRLDVWEALGGFDPHLTLFRDDVDFCWRANLAGHRVACETAAVLHHAEAASSGKRRIDVGNHRRHLLDRRNAIYVVLANVPLLALPVVLTRVVLSSLLRVTGLLVSKLPAAAGDELLALLGALGRPDLLLRARPARRATRTLPARSARHLIASPRAQARHALEAFAGVLSGGLGSRPSGDLTTRGHRGGTDNDLSVEVDNLPSPSTGLLGRVLRRPSPAVGLTLVVLCLLAGRRLIGAGRLLGGSLLPAPAGASDLWRQYAESWHQVGLGSSMEAPPWTAELAGLSALAGGRAPLAVDLLLLLGVAAGGVSASLALRGVLRSRLVRGWAGVSYALLPVATGSVAGGRLGLVVALITLPLVARGSVAAARGSTRSAWACGLALVLPVAFVPRFELLAAVSMLLAAPLVVRSLRGGINLLVVLAVPLVLLAQSVLLVWREPWRLLAEAGLPTVGLAPRTLQPAAVALLHPGGPGMYPVWLSLPLLVVGLSALGLRRRRRLALGAWAMALPGLAAGLLLMTARTTPRTGGAPLAVWVGPETLLLGLGLVLAAALAADNARVALRGAGFGWRQPLALVLAVGAGAMPVLVGAWWVKTGSDGPLERRDPVLLPAYVAAESTTGARPRTLVIRALGEGRLGYTLLGAAGPRLGDPAVAPPASSSGRVGSLVADLAAGRGGDAASSLGTFGVRYLLVDAPVPPRLASTLDALPGLARLSAQGGSALWNLVEPVGRARLQTPEGTMTPVDSGPGGTVDASIEPGVPGRLLVLAERAHDGWQADLGGVELPPVIVDGWAQGFAVPAEGGRVLVEHRDPGRDTWLTVQRGLALLVLLLALPGARRRRDPDDDVRPALPAHGWVPAPPVERESA